MNFERALIHELQTITELQNRVYPLEAPEATKHNGVPYLVFVSSEGLPDKALDGFMASKEVRIELNILTESYKELKAITRKVVALIISFEGRTIGNDGPHVEEISFLQQPVEMFEE